MLLDMTMTHDQQTVDLACTSCLFSTSWEVESIRLSALKQTDIVKFF